MQLAAAESPYISSQAPSPTETFEFLKICSNKSDDIFKIRKATIWERIFHARLRYDQRFHGKVFYKITQYIKENTVTPEASVKSRFTTPSDMGEDIIKPNNLIPEQLLILALFANKYHMPLEKSLNMPICLVGWFSLALAAIEGADVSLDGEQEEVQADMENLKKWEKEQAEKVRLAMVNGKIPKKKIKLSSENNDAPI